MALLPTGIIVGTKSHASPPVEVVSSLIAGVSTSLALRDLSASVGNGRSVVIEASGSSHSYSAQKAYTAGTFAYEADTQIIRGVTTSINGVASTAAKLTSSEEYLQRRSLVQKDRGASYATAIRAGYFSFTGVINQRTPWTTPPAALSNTFKSTTSNSTDSDDQGIFVTYRSVPGEFVFMNGSPNPILADYPAK